MQLIPNDTQIKAFFAGIVQGIKDWYANKKRYIVPILFLLLPVALSKGDFSQARVLIMFLSVLAGASWAFFLMLSDQEGKGLLPDFSLKPLLDKSKETAISASIVVFGFFFLFATFLYVIAFLIAPR